MVEGHTTSNEWMKELQSHVKSLTAPYKYSHAIDFRTELPKTASLKIRRVELRQQENLKK
ncbi:acetate--CoA ligase [Planococcus antarcticus DSM 14505]|uniref:Acetate--CoA ligase n=1 Tax=Planococcus antarcticus DSM 14505 TaxID=1185653 RepID=A0AA87ILM1_9BACL|nr:acetate--CoA ligase [Planococcus antarcticus DSM 14505]